MRPRSLDLNLLVMLEALVAERSVSGAALRLGLTQSAVSHALRRLRETFNDELFVRSSKGMEPTPRAIEMADATRSALEKIGSAIDRSATFDPATAVRSFNLRISEYVSSHLLQRLCPVLRRLAPGIQISAAHFTGGSREDEIVGDEIHVRLGSSPVGCAATSCTRCRVGEMPGILSELPILWPPFQRAGVWIGTVPAAAQSLHFRSMT